MVSVERDGFERYEARISVRAGQETDLRATLVERSPSIFQRWWFWAGAAVVVTGAAATYAITRSDHRERELLRWAHEFSNSSRLSSP